MTKAIFAFDFSMSKPAMCVLINKELFFYTWPANIDNKSIDKLKDSGVIVFNRNLTPINKKEFNSHTLVMEHVTRSSNLSNMILNDIMLLLEKYNIKSEECIISSEGLSFASKGDATLNLASYKQAFLNKLYENGFANIKTYSPITIKSVAGCSKKGTVGKDSMINAIKLENKNSHKFIETLIDNEEVLKKKTSYIPTIDDLVDAYWCLKTTIIKEEISGICI